MIFGVICLNTSFYIRFAFVFLKHIQSIAKFCFAFKNFVLRVIFFVAQFGIFVKIEALKDQIPFFLLNKLAQSKLTVP